ncbi:MAG: CoA transferase [Gammaproteobacteria bacterium]|nr:CoA transferase [Gammaproteobacteria bacterium]
MQHGKDTASGPLRDLRVIEFQGLGPGPMCATFLGDMGADVIRIDRTANPAQTDYGALGRNRRSIALNLKHPAGVATALRLVAAADAAIDPFRPGVMERLGLGPEACLARNPRLVFGRMTGWGQDGPLAQAAGHDINYIAVTGALHAIGERGRKPVPPLALVGDYGGGALYLAFGMACALLEAQRTGQGQIVDAAMVDGVALLMSAQYGIRDRGGWAGARGENMLDGGAHFYGCYECADGEWISLGAMEPQFYALLREQLGLDDPAFDAQNDPAAWPALTEMIANVVRGRTRAEWCALLEGTDVCFAPVLTMDEARSYPPNVGRKVFVDVDGERQAAPGPRLSRTPASVRRGRPRIGVHTDEVLGEFGFTADEIATLREAGGIG